jgi:hypothetical protein
MKANIHHKINHKSNRSRVIGAGRLSAESASAFSFYSTVNVMTFKSVLQMDFELNRWHKFYQSTSN